jgi:hypothetical protein
LLGRYRPVTLRGKHRTADNFRRSGILNKTEPMYLIPLLGDQRVPPSEGEDENTPQYEALGKLSV